VRAKAIITGAIAAIGIATLTANASSAPRANSLGSVVSLLAGTATIMKADRDAVSVATRGTSAMPAIAGAAEKPLAAVKPASARFTLSAACQQAINALKALHQADVAEDAAELARRQPLSLTALQAAHAEDLAEAQQWRNALTAARTACLPAPSAACQAAISNLQTLLQAGRRTDLAGLKAAFGAVATACAHRD
jgi:hypothetical protein